MKVKDAVTHAYSALKHKGHPRSSLSDPRWSPIWKDEVGMGHTTLQISCEECGGVVLVQKWLIDPFTMSLERLEAPQVVSLHNQDELFA